MIVHQENNKLFKEEFNLMKKKMIISTATALTLLAAPFAGSADAAGNEKIDCQTKVYTYKYNGNSEEMNKWVQDILSKYQIQMQGNAQAPQKEKQAPAPVKEQAPKAEAPAPAPKQEAPKAEAPAPAPASEQPKTEQPAQAEAQNSQLSQFEQQVVELTNQERAKQGLPALKVDTELSKVAREKSKDMQAKNYFSHTSPTYGSPFDMMKQFGIEYSSAGENIAMGQPSPEEVVKAWMNSDGHRKNIMSSDFTHIGVGYVENGNYWTQMFIGK
jgi:uncharacterized YkwD family protein